MIALFVTFHALNVTTFGSRAAIIKLFPQIVRKERKEKVIMANKLKAGIIGCGGIANGKHMPSIKALGETELVAFAICL